MRFFSRAAKLLQKGGWRKFRMRIESDRCRRREVKNYQKWILANRLTETMRETMRGEIKTFGEKILISVVLPVYNVEEKWLRLCIESVKHQVYQNWELCIADDCSPSVHVRRILEEYAAQDERIKIVFRSKNGHISAASNSALEIATGEFVGLLDHDDELAEDALFHVAGEIIRFPETDFIYSDEDKIDETGVRYSPKFKPKFSLDFLYSVNYATHFAVYRTAILRRVGGFRVGLEGSQDYDLALRVVEQISENHICHIPRILYHWRAIRGSVALSSDEKPYAHERAREAIRGHLERTGKQATVEETIYNLHRVRYELPSELPKVSLIFTADENLKFTEKAIENFIEQTDYANFEIVLVRTSCDSGRTNLPNIKLLVCENKNKAEQLNFAAAQADGEILCFTDANLKPLAVDWLKELSSFALQTEIGAVGAKILETDENVLHGGLIIADERKIIGAAHRGYQRDSSDNIGRLQLINNFSAVSVSCLMTRRKVFESVGGYDAQDFPNRFFDADFCLKLRERNYRIVFTPYAELIKLDKKRRLNLEEIPTAEEKNYFVKRWSKFIGRDAFYNPNLSQRKADFSIEVQMVENDNFTAETRRTHRDSQRFSQR